MSGPPFSIDPTTPAATDIISAYPANEQANRNNILSWLTFLSNPTTGIINLSSLPPNAQGFDSGTKMLFVQTNTPTGWTKDVTHNDVAIRIVNGTAGTGGTTAFSSVFVSGLAASSVALSVAQLPVHSHNVTGNTGTESADHSHYFSGTFGTDAQGNHAHNPNIGGGFLSYGSSSGNLGSIVGGSGVDGGGTTDYQGNHAHNVTVAGNTGGRSAAHYHGFNVTSGNAGSGSTHNHTVPLAVNYVDVIVGTKN